VLLTGGFACVAVFVVLLATGFGLEAVGFGVVVDALFGLALFGLVTVLVVARPGVFTVDICTPAELPLLRLPPDGAESRNF